MLWLKDYQKLEDDISYLQFHLEQLQQDLQRVDELKSVSLPGASEKKINERIEKTKQVLEVKEAERKKFLEVIKVFKGVENQILVLKYVEHLTLDEIAERLNYSASHIKNTHAEIMKVLKLSNVLKELI